MTITNISHDRLVIIVNIMIKPRIIASSASSVIKRWFRCMITHVRAINTSIGEITVIQEAIVYRNDFCLWFTRPALQVISFIYVILN